MGNFFNIVFLNLVCKSIIKSNLPEENLSDTLFFTKNKMPPPKTKIF